MEIIMLKDLEKVGKANEIVTVKAGYGRNYLIPQGFAIVANKKNRSEIEERQRIQQEAEERLINEFKAIQAKLEGKVLRIGAKAGTSGKIFGSVTTLQIVQELQNQFGIEVDKKKVVLPEDVKEIFVAVLAHRIFLKSRTKSEYTLVTKYLKSILSETRAP